MSYDGNGSDSDEPKEVVRSPTDFDHPNAELMNRFFLPTVNHEPTKYGYIPGAQIELAKLDARIILDLAYIAIGDVDSQMGLIGESTKWSVDRLIETARDGFGAKVPQTDWHNENVNVPRRQGGFGEKLPIVGRFFRKKEPEVMEGQR